MAISTTDYNPGFYRVVDGTIEFAPNYVFGPDYTLVKEDKDNYDLPLPAGWGWYDTLEAATAVLGELPLNSPNLFGIVQENVDPPSEEEDPVV